MLKSFAPHL